MHPSARIKYLFISISFGFISQDINYTQPLVMPPIGIELRTNVFVQVEATNLTSQYDMFH